MIDFNSNIEKLSDKNLSLFIDAVEQYVILPKQTEVVSEMINQALEVFNQIPSVFSTSIFLLNELNFEFEHKSTLPEQFKEDSIKQFNKLVEIGYLGSALQSGKVIVTPDEYYESGNNENIIVPLVVSWGIIGLIIVTGRDYSGGLSNILLKLCAIQGNILASNLERVQVYKTLQLTKSELEQKVAARTMDLAQSKRELKAILDSIHTGILVVEDLDNTIIRVNPTAANLIKDSDINILRNKSDKYLIDIDLNDYEFGRTFECELITNNGQYIPILRSITILTLGNGKFRIESFVDISDRKSAEIALKQVNEILELKVLERTKDLDILIDKLKIEIQEREVAEKEAKRMLDKEKELRIMKNQFISMVSHEFRTPLTVIKSASQIVELYSESLSDTEKEDYLKRIINTVDYMTDLIENVIFIGRNETDKIKHNISEVDLKVFCNQIIKDILLSNFESRIINIKFEGEFNIYLVDVKVLKLILTNVLSNAIKYSQFPNPIDFTISSEDDKYIFVVQDYGIGIPDSDKDKIYDLFQRSSNVGNISGTGLGMAVVLQSVKVLSGFINFESVVNQGTKFIITLPHNAKLNV